MNVDWAFHAYAFFGSLPVIVVLVTGGVLCISRSWRHPRACRLVGLAILIDLASRFVLPFVASYLYRFLLDGFGQPLQMIVSGFLYSLPSAISLGLLLYVIFSTGGAASMKPMPWEEEP